MTRPSLTPHTPHTPPRRVDAERNRERILTAARDAFADPEADVSMAEISRRAEVGSATLYRNFANRRQLLEALYIDEIDAVCEAAASIGEDPPGASLTAWLHRFYAYFTSKRLVAAELLKHSDADDPVFGTGYARVLGAGRPLLLAAQASGEARRDLTLEQVLDMVAAIAKIPGDASYREPILQAALDALRPIDDG
ncbi:MAG TPA: TetR/AcrR family transcriptional regulator [Solirubrobacteraceae bacterium]|jgi:AcrR family transcriptional regulator|nr:TetR/AcrR family transcriptional regulator [Solirubrobacteraceae bacterium]